MEKQRGWLLKHLCDPANWRKRRKDKEDPDWEKGRYFICHPRQRAIYFEVNDWIFDCVKIDFQWGVRSWFKFINKKKDGHKAKIRNGLFKPTYCFCFNEYWMMKDRPFQLRSEFLRRLIGYTELSRGGNKIEGKSLSMLLSELNKQPHDHIVV